MRTELKKNCTAGEASGRCHSGDPERIQKPGAGKYADLYLEAW